MKSSDILLNDLIPDPAFVEIKMEPLKTHEFRFFFYFITLSCDRREDGSPAHNQPWPHKVFTVLDINYFEPYQI